jgi:hypothetical protein
VLGLGAEDAGEVVCGLGQRPQAFARIGGQEPQIDVSRSLAKLQGNFIHGIRVAGRRQETPRPLFTGLGLVRNSHREQLRLFGRFPYGSHAPSFVHTRQNQLGHLP